MKVPLRLLAQLRLLMGKGLAAGPVGPVGEANLAASLATLPGIPPVAALSHVTGVDSSISQVCFVLLVHICDAPRHIVLFCKSAQDMLCKYLRLCTKARGVERSG